MATNWNEVGPKAFSVMREVLVILRDELDEPTKNRFADIFEAGRKVYSAVDREDR